MSMGFLPAPQLIVPSFRLLYVPPAGPSHAIIARIEHTKLPAIARVPTIPASGPIRLPTKTSSANESSGRRVAIRSNRAGAGIVVLRSGYLLLVARYSPPASDPPGSASNQ